MPTPLRVNPLLRTDSYKLTHFRQYPPDTEIVYSYLESRGGMFDRAVANPILQYYLEAYLEGKVFTRETLLSRVWGYEYYGGARTVDVHVRRLRAKLGEEHAHLIQTVRSVGYRFGQVGWLPMSAARLADA